VFAAFVTISNAGFSMTEAVKPPHCMVYFCKVQQLHKW